MRPDPSPPQLSEPSQRSCLPNPLPITGTIILLLPPSGRAPGTVRGPGRTFPHFSEHHLLGLDLLVTSTLPNWIWTTWPPHCPSHRDPSDPNMKKGADLLTPPPGPVPASSGHCLCSATLALGISDTCSPPSNTGTARQPGFLSSSPGAVLSQEQAQKPTASA